MGNFCFWIWADHRLRSIRMAEQQTTQQSFTDDNGHGANDNR